MEHLPLKELAELSYGRPASRFERAPEDKITRRRKNAPDPVWSQARIMSVSALAAWPNSLSELEQRELDISREECFAQENDVIMALSAPFPSSCIRKEELKPYPLFIPNSCALIRAGERLDPWYLAGYLSLDIIRTQALPQQSGGGRAVILTLEQLKELHVLVPSLDVQHTLAKVTFEYAQLESARRAVFKHEQELMQAAFARALGGELG